MNIIEIIKNNFNEEESIKMKKHMKDNFEFLGLRSPLRKKIQNDFFKTIDKKSSIDEGFVSRLYNEDYREYKYFAIDYLIKKKKQLQKNDINLIKELILNEPWWDTVDLIASHLVGELCKNYPELVNEIIIDWSIDENIWIRRSAIIYQLKYKNNTNEYMLSTVIKNNLGSKEFFINKAIGWALREYSKSNKEWVRDFIMNNDLSSLSTKEGSKYL